MNVTFDSIVIGETATVAQTRAPKKEITNEVIVAFAERNTLPTGMTICIQCTDAQRAVILWERNYRVSGRAPYYKRTENLRGDPHGAEAVVLTIVPLPGPLGEWWEVTPEEQPESAESDDGELTVRWNNSERVHEVIDPEGDVIATFTKDDGGKDAAQAFIYEQKVAA